MHTMTSTSLLMMEFTLNLCCNKNMPGKVIIPIDHFNLSMGMPSLKKTKAGSHVCHTCAVQYMKGEQTDLDLHVRIKGPMTFMKSIKENGEHNYYLCIHITKNTFTPKTISRHGALHSEWQSSTCLINGSLH